jgi:Integrase core domain
MDQRRWGGEAVEGGLGGLPGRGYLHDPLADDTGVGAGLQRGPVAAKATVAVGQDPLGSGAVVVERGVGIAGGRDRLAGGLEVVGVGEAGQPGIDPWPEGAELLVTPVQAPNANAYAERWIRTVRAECLDWLLIVGRGHLEQVLRRYVEHSNRHRPHRALGLEPPDPSAGLALVGEARRARVRRRDLLRGLLHEHRRAA